MLPAPALRPIRNVSRLLQLAYAQWPSDEEGEASRKPLHGESEPFLRNRGSAASTSGRAAPEIIPSYSAFHQQHAQFRGFASQTPPAADQHAQGTAQGSDPPKDAPFPHDVVYEGPLSKTHKMLKRISIANTAIALAAAPAIVMFADISYASRVGLATTLVFFGLITTGALHWITHPYVHELRFHADTQTFDAKMTTLLGRTKMKHFKLSDVQPLPWDRPVATFMANDEFYYIDVYSFPDEALLKRLTPPEDQVPAGYKDDKDDD